MFSTPISEWVKNEHVICLFLLINFPAPDILQVHMFVFFVDIVLAQHWLQCLYYINQGYTTVSLVMIQGVI